ncbi:MAG: TIGR00725 family protein [Elusimicrobia bacterium]|nr:TIGR00725 family protein [Elusimicrobiota bacterium]
MKTERLKIVGVIGGASCSQKVYAIARRLGELLAENNFAVVCGGLSGVMKGVCEGAYRAGGITIGILPGKFSDEANAFVKIPIVTAMSHARNAIIVRTADVVVAVDGKYGTLSEIALALSIGKRVFSIETTWNVKGVEKAESPESVVSKLKKILR